jgi:hypothetical protein
VATAEAYLAAINALLRVKARHEAIEGVAA